MGWFCVTKSVGTYHLWIRHPGSSNGGADCGRTNNSNFQRTKRKRSLCQREKKRKRKKNWNSQKKRILGGEKMGGRVVEKIVGRLGGRGVWHLVLLESRRRPLEEEREEEKKKEKPRGSVSPADRRRTLIDMFLLARVMFLLGTDRQTAPVHTGAIQGNCVNVTSPRKNLAHKPFFATQVPPTTCCSFHIFPIFFPLFLLETFHLSLSLSLTLLGTPLVLVDLSLSLPQCMKYLSPSHEAVNTHLLTAHKSLNGILCVCVCVFFILFYFNPAL